MKNVLINAYAVSPTWGSEPGMGWNWIINIAKHCNVFVITEGEWEKEINNALEYLPQKDNLHFHYNPVSDKIRKMCWNQGDWRFYWYYKKWQKRAFKIAQGIIQEQQIDVIHQLNMVGFREPGYLWKIEEIPFVWGPICGMDTIPIKYLNGGGIKNTLLSRIKNILNRFQFRFHPRVKAAIKKAKVVISATIDAQKELKRVHDKESIWINETGTQVFMVNDNNKKDFSTDVFNVLWVGRFIHTKRLDIALKSIAKAQNKRIIFTICGSGQIKDINKYHNLAYSLGINDQIIWKGKISHNEIWELMRESDLFFFTSIMEATSTVILEAISSGLPILSFNTCGFGPLVKDFAGKTIELSNVDKSIDEFAEQLNLLSNNPNLLKKYSQQERNKMNILSWDYKAKQIMDIYTKIINQ